MDFLCKYKCHNHIRRKIVEDIKHDIGDSPFPKQRLLEVTYRRWCFIKL